MAGVLSLRSASIITGGTQGSAQSGTFGIAQLGEGSGIQMPPGSAGRITITQKRAAARRRITELEAEV